LIKGDYNVYNVTTDFNFKKCSSFESIKVSTKILSITALFNIDNKFTLLLFTVFLIN